MLLMVTSSIRLSPNRSQVRTDQNTRTIQSCLLWIFQLKIQAPQNLSSCVVILCLSVPLVGCKKFYLWTTSLDCKYLIPSATSLWNRMFLQFNFDTKKLSKKSFLLKLIIGPLSRATFSLFNTFTPMSDQERISPYIFNPIFSRKVMRIEKNSDKGIFSRSNA